MGRTATYTAATYQQILDGISQGQSLRSICAADGFPHEATVRAKVMDDADFATQYARARSIGIDAQAEGTIDLADDMSIPADQKRLMLDARKWFASKLRPDKYGDKLATTLSAPDGGPVQSVHRLEFIEPKRVE